MPTPSTPPPPKPAEPNPELEALVVAALRKGTVNGLKEAIQQRREVIGAGAGPASVAAPTEAGPRLVPLSPRSTPAIPASPRSMLELRGGASSGLPAGLPVGGVPGHAPTAVYPRTAPAASSVRTTGEGDVVGRLETLVGALGRAWRSGAQQEAAALVAPLEQLVAELHRRLTPEVRPGPEAAVANGARPGASHIQTRPVANGHSAGAVALSNGNEHHGEDRARGAMAAGAHQGEPVPGARQDAMTGACQGAIPGAFQGAMPPVGPHEVSDPAVAGVPHASHTTEDDDDDTLKTRAARLEPPVPAQSRLVTLPPFRHPFMLVVDGTGEPAGAPVLAEALEIDLATARMYALHRHARALIRGTARDELERKAGRVRALAGLRASVLSRDELQAVASPLAVVAALPDLRWKVVDTPLWETEPDEELPLIELEAQAWRLAVWGEVVSRRFRDGQTNGKLTRLKQDRPHELTERRVYVLDLYADGRSIRLVTGTTDFRGLPGHDPTSSMKSYRALIEQLGTIWPGIRIEGRRVCEPPEAALKSGESEGGRAEVTGWSVWGEHSAVCLLHAGVR